MRTMTTAAPSPISSFLFLDHLFVCLDFSFLRLVGGWLSSLRDIVLNLPNKALASLSIYHKSFGACSPLEHLNSEWLQRCLSHSLLCDKRLATFSNALPDPSRAERLTKLRPFIDGGNSSTAQALIECNWLILVAGRTSASLAVFIRPMPHICGLLD